MASILVFFVCLNSCSLSGHLPRAALLAEGAWESPELILNDATGEKQGSTEHRRAHPSTSLLRPFWLLPVGSARAAGKAKGFAGTRWVRRTPEDGTNMRGSAWESAGVEQRSACPTTALLRITGV